VSAFKNQGAHGILTVLGVKDEGGKFTQKVTTRKQIEELKAQFRPGGEYAGDENRGKIAATSKSVEWTNLGLSPVDLKILDSLGVTRGIIADAYGVPNQLLSGSTDRTYSNYMEAARSLWSNAIVPKLDSMLDKMGVWLIPQMGEKGFLQADYTNVDVLQRNKQELAQWMSQAEAFTKNEIREALGYDYMDTPEMDQVFVSLGKVPIDYSPNMDDTEKVLTGRRDYRIDKN
jgi:phage portal protein BeeE